VRALLEALERHGVAYVVTGSVAALLCGVPVEPGDLDVTPSLDRENLARLSGTLAELGAAQYPEEPFGRWETRDDGERSWVEFEPTDADRAARAAWRPDPDEPSSFDHLLKTAHGALDVVPEIAGAYEDLRARALRLDLDGLAVWVESLEDQLATLTVPRRARDVERVRALRALQRVKKPP
jgi:hypothetical protein